MNVYTAEKKRSEPDTGIFKHVGASPFAAADRIESMFASQRTKSFTFDALVNVHDESGQIVKTMSIDDLLHEFCTFARQFVIREYSFQYKHALRLIDLWEDDPLGSAGPSVVDCDTMGELEKKELQTLFAPFSDVIYPPHVYAAYSRNEIKAIRNRLKTNGLFEQEFKKRKARARAIGEDFGQSQYQETIWLDLTLKLRSWAIAKEYDAFYYSNSKEGDGSNTYITLLPNQLTSTGLTLEFLEEKYLSEMPNIIRNLLPKNKNAPPEVKLHLLWGLRNPLPYWAYSKVPTPNPG